MVRSLPTNHNGTNCLLISQDNRLMPVAEPTRKPDKPFYFNTSEHLLRISRFRASTIGDL